MTANQLRARVLMQQLELKNYRAGLDRLNTLAERAQPLETERCLDSLRLLHGDNESGTVTTWYNIVLKAFANCADAKGAGEFFGRMVEHGVKLNHRTFSKLAEAASKDGDAELALKWIERGRSLGFEEDVVSKTTVIDALSRSGRGTGASQGQSQMGVSCQQNTQSFNAVINGHAERSDLAKAEAVFESMLAAKVRPSVITFNCLLKACARVGNGVRADHWFDKLIEHGCTPTAITFAAIMSTWGSAGNPRKAERAFAACRVHKLACDLGVYMAVIQAFERNGEVFSAERWYRRMTQVGLRPGLSEFNALMHAAASFPELCKQRQMANGRRAHSYAPEPFASSSGEPVGPLARWWYRLIEADLVPDIASLHILLRDATRRDDNIGVRWVQDNLKKYSVKPNKAFCTSLLRFYLSNSHASSTTGLEGKTGEGGLRRAEEFLQLMSEMNLTADIVTYTAIIDAHAKRGNFAAALKYFEELKSKGLKPDVVCYNCLIEAAARSRDFKAMDSFLTESIQKFGIVKGSESGYIFAMLTHAKTGNLHEVERLFQQLVMNLKSGQVWSRAYAAVLTGYAVQGDLQACYGVIQEMERSGVRPEIRTFDAVLRMLQKYHDRRVAAEWSSFSSRKMAELNQDGRGMVSRGSVRDGPRRAQQQQYA